MTKKQIPVRIINKHGTEAYWISNSDFIPLQAEFIVYDEDETHSYKRLKIGDGVTTIGNLPFCGTNSLTDTDKEEIIGELRTYVDDEILGGEW